jgi:hypothetical protein
MKWWQNRKRNADLERELRSDLELEEEEQRENGVSPEEARYAALRAFGNATLIKEQTREAWGWTRMERLLQDFRERFAKYRYIKASGLPEAVSTGREASSAVHFCAPATGS